ncbi:hypothetical protein Tco_0200833 [Tanacetum coccineum]
MLARIDSSGLPGSLTLWMILPKNFHKGLTLFLITPLLRSRMDSGLRTKTYQLKLIKRIRWEVQSDDNGISSKDDTWKEICETLR